MTKRFLVPMMIAAAVLAAPAAPVLAQSPGVEIGMLVCNVAAGPGYVIASSRPMTCTFGPSGGPAETYTGAISKLGVDIGYQSYATIYWLVFAPTGSVGPGALAGTYVGGGASATVGIGLGANALIGGFQQSINLQPISVQGSVGLDVAAGVGGITLQYAP
jgi:hypothetical protein